MRLNGNKELLSNKAIKLLDGAAGTLRIGRHNVRINDATIERVVGLARTESSSSLSVRPRIPHASSLGLAPCPELLQYSPSAKLGGRIMSLFRKNYAHPMQEINECSTDEQVDYYATQYARWQPKPIQASVVVSNICNLTCVMCPYHGQQYRKEHKTDYFNHRVWMPWERMEAIAQECGRSRIPVKMGNIEEPLLHPRIVDFVKCCRQHGAPSVHITTNGTVMNPTMSRNLLDAGLTSLYVSLDAAHPQTYQDVRQRKLEEVINNIKGFLAIRNSNHQQCRVMLSMVRNPQVLQEEADLFIESWLSQVDGVVIYDLVKYINGGSRCDRLPDFVQEKLKTAATRWPCLNPWQEVYILPDGNVTYCCEMLSKMAYEPIPSMGRFPEESLDEIWAGESFARLRKDLILNRLEQWNACRQCAIWMAHHSRSRLSDSRRITQNMICTIIEKA